MSLFNSYVLNGRWDGRHHSYTCSGHNWPHWREVLWWFSVSSTLECTLPLQSYSPGIVDPSDWYCGFPLDFSNYLLAEICIVHPYSSGCTCSPTSCTMMLGSSSSTSKLLVRSTALQFSLQHLHLIFCWLVRCLWYLNTSRTKTFAPRSPIINFGMVSSLVIN